MASDVQYVCGKALSYSRLGITFNASLGGWKRKTQWDWLEKKDATREKREKSHYAV